MQDADLFWRAQLAGAQLVYAPTAVYDPVALRSVDISCKARFCADY